MISGATQSLGILKLQLLEENQNLNNQQKPTEVTGWSGRDDRVVTVATKSNPPFCKAERDRLVVLMTNQSNNYCQLTRLVSEMSVRLNEKVKIALGSTHLTQGKLIELDLAKRMLNYICTKSRIDNPLVGGENL